MDSKTKSIEEDPDKRWITTWNDYLGRIKYFFRWMYNYNDKRFEDAVRKLRPATIQENIAEARAVTLKLLPSEYS